MDHQPAPIGAPSNVVKLPYSVTRRAYTRRPRRLKNGSPEERAILIAAAERARGHVLRLADDPSVRAAAPVVFSAEETGAIYGQLPPAEQRVISDMVEKALAKPQEVAAEPPSRVDRDGWYRRFGQRLRAARIALGITEEEAAAAAGRSVQTWRGYETTGRGRCTLAVGKFALHYGVKLDDLFSDDETPAPTRASEDPPMNGSETGRNERLRRDRREVWRTMEHKLDYWNAYQKLHFAIYNNREVLDDLDCPAALRRKHGDFSQPWVLDNELRNRVHAAEVALLLTPAPDIASLKWKQQRAAHQWYQPPTADTEYLRRHMGREQSPFRDIEKAIADDVAWLDAHPARQCKANKNMRAARPSSPGGAS